MNPGLPLATYMAYPSTIDGSEYDPYPRAAPFVKTDGVGTLVEVVLVEILVDVGICGT